MTESKKIFSFDIGTASIGWAVIETPKKDTINYDEQTGEIFSGIKLIDSGVRMFNEPIVAKSGELLNVKRRASRLLRRRTKRLATRKKLIKNLLLSLGYYTKEDFEHYLEGKENYNSVFQRVIKDNKKEPEKHNIFHLRVKALDSQLTKDELAVVLFNLAKTRGFKSSKKIKKGENELEQTEKNLGNSEQDKESGKVLKAIKNLEKKKQEIEEKYGKKIRTFAELIYFLNQKEELNSYRNKGSDYSNSILRSNIEQEAKEILKKQREFYKELTEDFEKQFLDILLFQREIKFNPEIVGKCTYEKDEFRAAKACFSSEYFIALGKLINLRINTAKEERFLEKNEIESILNDALSTYKVITYKQLRKSLDLAENSYFKGLAYSENTDKQSLYSKDKVEDKELISFKNTKEVDKYLKDLVSSNKLSQENYNYLTNKNNYKILDLLVQLNSLYKSENQLKEAISKNEVLKNLNEEIKDAIIYCNLSFTTYINLSLKALYKITPLMSQVYFKAIVNNIETQAEDKTKRIDTKTAIDELIKRKELPKHEIIKKNKLPTLKEIEKDYYIPNHSVIIRSISQVRKIFNAMVESYGKPNQVNIELLRELKNPSNKTKHITTREDNTIQRENARSELKKIGLEDTEANILMYMLFLEQAHTCPYCQGNISLPDLSRENILQVDHIIPESISFDNSFLNKVLVHTNCNQDKKNQTPYLFFKEQPQKWEAFKNCVYSLNVSRKKREKLLNMQSIEELKQGFVERQRNDSAYISILIKDFIENYFNFPKDESNRHVFATKGALTSLLRDMFEFKKYRSYEDVKVAKANYLYKKVVWNKDKNPIVVEELNNLRKEVEKAKKQEDNGNKAAKKEYDSLKKQYEDIRKSFLEYLPEYFAKDEGKAKPLKVPESIKKYLEDTSFVRYLTELKINNNFEEDFLKIEEDFIGDKHHAMDAILVGLSSPSIIKQISTLANKADTLIKDKITKCKDIKEKNKLLKVLYKDKITNKVRYLIEDEDWVKNNFKINNIEDFKNQIKQSLQNIFVSRQPNRKIFGRIHEDTIYSNKDSKKVNDGKGLKLTKKVDVSSISVSDLEKRVLGSPQLKIAIKNWLENKEENKPSFPRMPTKTAKEGPIIRKVTVVDNGSGESYFNVRKGLVDSDKKIRIDIFKIKKVDKKGKVYYANALRPITLADILIKKEIPLKLSGNFGNLEKEDGGENQEFLFSLYPGDLFRFKKNKDDKEYEYAYYLSYRMDNLLEYTDHNKLKKSKIKGERLFLSIASVYSLEKAEVDILGKVKSVVKNNKYIPIDIKK